MDQKLIAKLRKPYHQLKSINTALGDLICNKNLGIVIWMLNWTKVKGSKSFGVVVSVYAMNVPSLL